MDRTADRPWKEKYADRLFADQVHKQYEHTVFGTAATLINSIFLVYILRSHADHVSLLIWFVFAVLISAVRLILHRQYHRLAARVTPKASWWNRWFVVTLLLSGVLWGSTAVFIFSSHSIGHQAFIALVTGGMVAGAVSIFTAVLANFFIFSLPALIPISICFFLQRSEMHLAMGAMVFLFLTIMSLTAIHMHRRILNLLSMKYERTDLATSLQNEISRRKETQKRLRRQKDEIEETVTRCTTELKKTNEKYQDLVENINDVLYTADMEGRITYISPVIETVLGYTPDELTGKSLFSFVDDMDRRMLKKDFAYAVEAVGRHKDYRFRDSSGEIKWCRVSLRPISDGRENIGIQGVLVDINWSKRLEEQLQRSQKMEALGTLAGGVAHDLNNILSGIVSYPELLLMDLPQESPLRRPLTTIQRSGENAAAIVQDLLTLARRGVPTHECLNLNEIVRRCLASADIEALLHSRADVRYKVALQSDLLNVYGSSIHIFKSISNLLFNAVEAMPNGGAVKIATFNRYTDDLVAGFDTIREGEYTVLSIADTGIGMSERDRARIFEPFFTTKVMGRSGSGLGMAVVGGTVKDHSGYIDIHSEEGRGTRFELYFPSTRDPLKKGRDVDNPADYAGNGEFILVVDDLPTQREIATSILNRLGYRSKAVGSGQEAIEFLRTASADLLILDMILNPGIDGYETYRRIKQIHTNQKAIITSGYSETTRLRMTMDLGAGRYIKKPYTLATVGRAIKEELRK